MPSHHAERRRKPCPATGATMQSRPTPPCPAP